jgi:hypothetical protein
MPFFPISGAFDGVTGLFTDSSGRSSRATSLTSSDPFDPLGHFPCCLIPMIQRSTFTADLFFNIQPLIAAKSSFRVGSPSAQCDAPRSPSPPLPRDRCHACDSTESARVLRQSPMSSGSTRSPSGSYRRPTQLRHWHCPGARICTFDTPQLLIGGQADRHGAYLGTICTVFISI